MLETVSGTNFIWWFVHLLTLASLLVQFQHKQRSFLFSIYLNNVPRTLLNVEVPLNNLTIFLRYDKMCDTLLTSARDDDRYETVVKLNETTTGRCVFILGTARDDISCNSTRRRSVLSQEITAQQIFKHFRRNKSVPSNFTRTDVNLKFTYYFMKYSIKYKFNIFVFLFGTFKLVHQQ